MFTLHYSVTQIDMTSKQKALNLIRERIPELMELSFGCEVKLEDHAYKCYWCLGKTEDQYHYLVDKGDDERCNYVVYERDGWKLKEILGHPPQLHHWLQLLDGKFEYLFTNGTVHENVSGEMGAPILKFNLKTGQPATEEDFRLIYDLCSHE